MTVYRGIDKRNFDVHKPFKFSNFGVTKWDELKDIIPKKKNKVVEDLMNSLSKKYEILRATPDELGIKSNLSAPRQAPLQITGRKRKVQELNLRFISLDLNATKVFLKECHLSTTWLSDKVDVDTLLTYPMMASNVNTLANQRFCMVLRSLIHTHPDKEKLKLKRVKLKVVGYSLD
ncbi:hypothetical protein Tco_1468343 [Tanacetum coccineum]